MTHTKRIYNRQIRKCHRVNLETDPQKSLKELVESGEIKNPLWNSVHSYGISYHPYRMLCMGKCPSCRDRSKDQHHLRKIRKREFRKELLTELLEFCEDRKTAYALELEKSAEDMGDIITEADKRNVVRYNELTEVQDKLREMRDRLHEEEQPFYDKYF